MGACCSKTDSTITSTPTPPEVKIKPNPQHPEKKKADIAIVASPTEQEALKKDVFVLKHRKSHEIDRHPDQETRKSIDRKKIPVSGPNTDTSQSATSNSTGAGGVSTDESGKFIAATIRTSSCTKEEVDAILIQCGRLSRSSSGVKPAGGETPTHGRRYSGSKRSFDFDLEIGSKNDDDEAAVDGDQHRRQQQWDPKVSSPSSRRRSRERDPQQQRSGSKERGSGNGGRRVSRSPNRRSESPNSNSNGTIAAGGGSNRPGKMVSVPATDKSNNAGGGEVVAGVGGNGVKRIQVKRNAGEVVVAAGSRTAASPRSKSPARANLRILSENQNPQPLTPSRNNSRKAEHSPYKRNPLSEIDTNAKPNGEKTMNNKTNIKNIVLDETKTNQISRTRSSRLSRDLDINPETLINPNQPSYASLLLKDIQSFHQNPVAAAAAPAFPHPDDLQIMKTDLVESEKGANDDLMEPSLHKYVTVRRGGDADTEDKESSGSNSFACSQQLSWMSSSWELNSGDSTDCWTSKLSSDARDTLVDRSGEHSRNGRGRGRVGIHGRSAYSLPNNATVAST